MHGSDGIVACIFCPPSHTHTHTPRYRSLTHGMVNPSTNRHVSTLRRSASFASSALRQRHSLDSVRRVGMRDSSRSVRLPCGIACARKGGRVAALSTRLCATGSPFLDTAWAPDPHSSWLEPTPSRRTVSWHSDTSMARSSIRALLRTWRCRHSLAVVLQIR